MCRDLVGAFAGFIISLMQPSSWDTFEASVGMWLKADPHLLIFVFLPPLVFSEANTTCTEQA
eukprot:3597935-Amphidinium_carterae.1